MKLLMENWRSFLNESVFYVFTSKLIPTEELGHGKDHDCPSEECERQIEIKIQQIQNGDFEPIDVCSQKPVVTARLQERIVTNLHQKVVKKNPFIMYSTDITD